MSKDFDAPYIVGNPDQFKSQLDDAGLKMYALHWNDLNDWRKEPTVILQTAKKLGAQYTGIAQLKVSKADMVTLDVVNEAADILTKAVHKRRTLDFNCKYHQQYLLAHPAGEVRYMSERSGVNEFSSTSLFTPCINCAKCGP